jgi:uncharacterized protein
VAEDELIAEMHALRGRVNGITGSALASRDGLIIKADTDLNRDNQDNLAALAAASLGLAQRVAQEVGQGLLQDAVTRNNGGFVALYSVGDTAVLIITGDQALKVGRLHSESRETVTNLEALIGNAASGATPR